MDTDNQQNPNQQHPDQQNAAQQDVDHPDSGQHTAPGAPEGDDLDARGAEQAQQAAEKLGADSAAAAGNSAAQEAGSSAGDDADQKVAELQHALEERTNDLKRLQAEYVNYKRRVDRDRSQARAAGIEAVAGDLLPVLDDLRTARQHEELTGGFKLLADAVSKVASKHGVETFGEKGEPFDPQIHDALMQVPTPGSGAPTVLDVMQVGYRLNGRVMRPARVAVAMFTGEEAPGQAPGDGQATGEPAPGEHPDQG